jgi:hypothetical protein
MPNNAIAEMQLGGRRKTLYERRRTVQVGLLVLLAVNGILGFLAFRPSSLQVGDIERLRTDRRERKETVDRLKKVEASLVESAKQGDQFYDTKFLPASTGFATIMEEVEKIATANGVKKGSVSYSTQPVKDREGIEVVEINTGIDGDY